MALHLQPPYSYSLSFRNHNAIALRPIITPIKSPISTRPLKIHCTSTTFSSSITSLSHLKPYLQSEWKPIFYGWLCSSVSVYCLSKLVPAVGEFSASMGPAAHAVNLKERCLILGALFCVRLISNYLQQAFLWKAALSSAYNIRVFVFRKVLQRELRFFEGESAAASGDIAYRITAEASDVADTVLSLLNTIVPSTLQLVTMATQMLFISPGLSLISALVIPLMALVIGYLGEKLRDVSNRAHLTIAHLSAYLNEVLPSILFVKANNAEMYEISRFQSLALDDLSASLGKKRMKAFIPQLVQAAYFGILFTFCATSLIISRGSFDCSKMVSFVTSLVLLIQPIQDFGKAYNELKQGEPAIQRLFSLTRFEPKENDEQNTVKLDCVAGEVNFSDVSFRYGDNGPLILKSLNFHIKAGQTVALVGPSGGGKTTMVKLLLRLYDPLQGTIQVDGYDIRSIRLDSLRRHVGLVSQDITLFSGTIAESIGYRDRMAGIDMDRVELAARTANADEFIASLPDGYQTNVGPRGSSFSGGQKQRIAIARAIYQDPSILILDEATSALDSRSEMLVRQALQRLMQNRTVLVIAHRLETVLMAERVFLLDNRGLQEIPRSSLLDSQHHGTRRLSVHPPLADKRDLKMETRKAELQAFDDTKAGVKGLVDTGITEVPRIFHKPPDNLEQSNDSNTDDNLIFPIIDLDGVKNDPKKRQEVVERIRDASETWGFFQVINHGVADEVLDEMLQRGVRKFFDQDTEVKKQWYSRDVTKPFYYQSNFDLYRSPVTNWRDTYACMMAPNPPNPQELPSVCRHIIVEYAKQVMELGHDLFELLSEALGLDPNHLNDIDCDKGILMLGHYYPACPQPELAIGTVKHADNDFFTVLLQDHIGGLQVLHQNRWVDVPPTPRALVINIGDLMQLITNDKFRSAQHRVLASGVGPRLSVACFFTTGSIPFPRLYGPIKELLSDDNPPKYMETTVKQFTEHDKGLHGTSAMLHLRL